MLFELRKDGTGVVAAQGVMDAGMATPFKNALLKAIDSADRVLIDLASVESMDVLCLQLVCSAMKSASTAGKEITFGDEIPAALERAALEAGYSNMAQCGG